MKKTNLVILAAGTNSRFWGQNKLFAPILGIPNVVNTLIKLQPIVNKYIIVVSSIEQKNLLIEILTNWNIYTSIEKKLIILIISPGGGCGGALLKCFNNHKKYFKKPFILLWSDVFINQISILENLIIQAKRSSVPVILPYTYSRTPYVIFKLHQNKILEATTEVDSSIPYGGFVDYSIFYIKTPKIIYDILNKLNSLNTSSELKFLSIFKELNEQNTPARAIFERYPNYFFNTPEELIQIESALKENFKKFRE